MLPYLQRNLVKYGIAVLIFLAMFVVGCSCSDISPEAETPPLPPVSTPDNIPAIVKSIPELLSIADVRVTDVTNNSAIVRWETSRPATSVIKYRKGEWSAVQTYTKIDDNHITSHTVELSGLASGTTYCVYNIICTGSGTVEYRGHLVFTTPSSQRFWYNFGGWGGWGGWFAPSGAVTTTYKSGDGTWDGSVWSVNVFPGENKKCLFIIHNGTDSGISVTLISNLVGCPAGGLLEASLTATPIVISSGASGDMEIIASFTQSAPTGLYQWQFSLNY